MSSSISRDLYLRGQEYFLEGVIGVFYFAVTANNVVIYLLQSKIVLEHFALSMFSILLGCFLRTLRFRWIYLNDSCEINGVEALLTNGPCRRTISQKTGAYLNYSPIPFDPNRRKIRWHRSITPTLPQWKINENRTHLPLNQWHSSFGILSTISQVPWVHHN